jgi:polyribonucleotide nucleotidyltransferase
MIKKEIDIGNKKIIIETGDLAKQADGAVVVKLGETAVLATAAVGKEPIPEEERRDMVPLIVDYRERTYAMGKIPGGFFKREGRPRERETITSRMIDRSIRPFFPKGLGYKLQVSVLVLSSDGENNPTIPALIGASCALVISSIPFNGPIGCINVTKSEDKLIVSPGYSEMKDNAMELTVIGTENNVAMLELKSGVIDEKTIIEAIKYVMPEVNKLIKVQSELRNEVGKPKIKLDEAEYKTELLNLIKPLVEKSLIEIVKISDKNSRNVAYNDIVSGVLENNSIKEKFPENMVKLTVEEFYRNEVRKYVLKNKIRIDGRKSDEIRPISCSVNVLPRTHGSALFTRGQTQSLVTVTLGTPHDRQIVEDLEGEYKERFMFHYNFPGFATGEVRPERGTSRREIGHGTLAKYAIYQLLPDEEKFPYTIRLVSDILESNGSSSMASVCGGSLALFDAGVSMKSSVAGVAMGLIKEKDDYVILTDILGTEDHFGDTDFKVAGTMAGVTAVQLDVKNFGLDINLIQQILEQAKSARIRILKEMDKAIEHPRGELSGYAPKMFVMQIPENKIGELIGPGGKNIRQIIEDTGTEIDIEDDGRVFITGDDAKSVELAKQRVERHTAEVEIGKTYNGKITRITDFGAFVEILPGKEGLVHVSKWSERRIRQVRDVAKEGDEILVKVTDIDNLGRVALSKKDAQK